MSKSYTHTPELCSSVCVTDGTRVQNHDRADAWDAFVVKDSVD